MENNENSLRILIIVVSHDTLKIETNHKNHRNQLTPLVFSTPYLNKHNYIFEMLLANFEITEISSWEPIANLFQLSVLIASGFRVTRIILNLLGVNSFRNLLVGKLQVIASRSLLLNNI